MTLPPLTVQITLAVLVGLAALFDIRFRRIPNWLSLAGIVSGFALNFTFFGWGGLLLSLKGLGVALLVYVPLFLIRAMGAGDGKLMAAIGACVGPTNWFGIFVLTAVFGAVLGLIVAAGKSRLRKTFENLYLILMSLRLRRAPYQLHPELDVKSDSALRLPHAVSIALGSLTFLALALANG